MYKKIIISIFLSFLLMACGGNSGSNTNSNSNTNVAGAGGNTTNSTNTANTTNVNTTANANANVKAADNLPKRISFGKGQNWGSANVSLAPNATQLFVVSAKAGQTMDVEASSKDVAINLRKGKAQTTEDFGYLNAELQSNGDYVFEVKNTTKKEVKASVKVTIEGGETTAKKDDKKSNPNEDEANVEEGDGSGDAEAEDKPQPTGTNTKKKGN